MYFLYSLIGKIKIFFTQQKNTLPKKLIALYEKEKPLKEFFEEMADIRQFAQENTQNLMGIDADIYEACKNYHTTNAWEIEKLQKQLEKTRRNLAAASSRLAEAMKHEKSSNSNSSYTSSSQVPSNRTQIVDDYGRTQGYMENGRLYNDKSDVVGYIDEYNRVYDKDHRRVGEVNKNGKIEKYN